jgi:hypothetical protein
MMNKDSMEDTLRYYLSMLRYEDDFYLKENQFSYLRIFKDKLCSSFG